MTIFERAEAHSGNAMAGEKNQKKRRRPGAGSGMCEQRKVGRSSTPRVSSLAHRHWHYMMFRGRGGTVLPDKSGYTQSHKWQE